MLDTNIVSDLIRNPAGRAAAHLRTIGDHGLAVSIITAADPQQLQRYSFALRTSEQIICRRCGVYVAMTLTDGDQVWSVINVDTLEDRALFTRAAESRDYSAEDREGRIARRKARWCPTTLIGWPALAEG